MESVINPKIQFPYSALPDYETKFELKDKHDKMMNALLIFDHYCRERGINYSLADGTLLGAIRHGDFIPWDDDADVMMIKEEYLKFRSSLRNDSPIKLFKIAFLDRVSTPELLEEHEFIDLFINEDMPASLLVFNWKKFKTAFLRTSFCGMAENYRQRKFPKGKKILHDLASTGIGAIARLIIGKRCVFDLNEKAVDIGKYKPSGFYTRFTSRMFETNRRFNKDSYNEGYADVLFRGHKLMAIKNADAFLIEMYGDYTKLLPEEKRIPEHPIDTLESADSCICRYN